jgi:hypothetical protein
MSALLSHLRFVTPKHPTYSPTQPRVQVRLKKLNHKLFERIKLATAIT